MEFLFRSATVRNSAGIKMALAIARRQPNEDWAVWEGSGRWKMEWQRVSWNVSTGWREARQMLLDEGFPAGKLPQFSKQQLQEASIRHTEEEMTRREALLRLLYPGL